MSRLARAEVFGPDEVAIVHVINRVVRRCFLLGDDPVTGKSFDPGKFGSNSDCSNSPLRLGSIGWPSAASQIISI